MYLARPRERVGALVENCKIASVTEDATALTSSHLFDDAKLLKFGKCRVHRRHSQPRPLDELPGG